MSALTLRVLNRSIVLLFLCLGAIISAATAANARENIFTDELASAAPGQCVLYVSWDKARPIDANDANKNATQRLMSEPEVVAFVDDLIARAGLMIPALDPGEDKARMEVLHDIGPKLANVMFRRRGCFFVEKFRLGNDGEPKEVKAALILDAGKEADSLAKGIASTLNAVEQHPNANSYSVALADNFRCRITASGGKLFVALGDSVLQDTSKRIAAGKVPAWLKAFRSGREAKHVSNISYLNLAKIRTQIVRQAGRQSLATIAAMGLGNAETLESCTGLTDRGAFSRMFLRLDGRPEGMLDLAGPGGLKPEDLKNFPADSLFASGLSLDMRRALGLMRTAIFLMSNGRENLDEIMDDMRREMGIDLQEDIVSNLGKSWTFYNGAGDGWLTGMTLTTTVKDAAALNDASDEFIKSILKASRGSRHAPIFRQKKARGQTITSFTIPEEGFFVEPAWCVTPQRLIVGLYPQAVESALMFEDDNRSPESILLSEEDLNFLSRPFAADEADSKLLAMTYVDAKTNFEISYPYMQVMSSLIKSLSSDFLRQFPEQVAAQISEVMSGVQLPRARVVHRHLEPSLLAIRQTDEGIELETSQTIPALDIGYGAPLAVGALLPIVHSTSAVANRVASMNNMRQQILGSLNFESAHMHFPAAYRVDKEGKKLLSWRVHILPFIEEGELYEQFRLDEPWDSPHNKNLLQRMPEVFRSPVSRAPRGMTVYRGIGGASGVLQPSRPGKNGHITFGDITDGSSNTIYIAEVSDEMAIEWTKPDDGLDPESIDFQKFFGDRDSANVTMCDGSTHSVSSSSSAMLKKMMTRNGGEVFNASGRNPHRTRRSRRSRRSKPVDVDPRFRLRGVSTLRLQDMLTDADQAELAIDDSMNKLKEIALAMHNFASANRNFPSAHSCDDSGKPLLSWRVHILPYLGESELYERFELNEPWDSPANRELIEQMPAVYKLDADLQRGQTGILGNGDLIRKPEEGNRNSHIGVGFENIHDGTSNTILVMSVPPAMAVEWTKPEVFSPDDQALQKIIGIEPIVALADGSVHAFKASCPLQKFREMLTIQGGEVTRNIEDHMKNR